jgi:hypothetical protein
MSLVVAGLASYKALQLIEALLPKELAIWVKLLISILLSYAAAALLSVEDLAVSGLAVAAVAGTWHTVLRLATLLGDLAWKKSVTR